MNNEPIFIMLVGLPGSGKSTYAKQLVSEIGATIHSSDEIRKELLGDENVQDKNDEVFKLLHKRVKDNLRNGINTIYDATNISSKRRMAFLSELKNIPCYKRCVIMATPYEKCLNNNKLRDKIVPDKAIKKMYKNWNTPYWFEGWDEIDLKYRNDVFDFSIVDDWLADHITFAQNNSHHSLSLSEHCMRVGEQLKGDNILFYAGLLHDCGKPFCKSFYNSKGELISEANYYQHHNVGAYDSLFFYYPTGINVLDVSILINLHMMPYFWEKDSQNGEKNRQKYKKIWGETIYNNVIKLHVADENAH